MLILGVISAVVLCIVPPYCSSTTKTEQYMIVDRDVDSESFDICRQIFPSNISGAPSNTSYRYYKYSSILEDDFHLSLGEHPLLDRGQEDEEQHGQKNKEPQAVAKEIQIRIEDSSNQTDNDTQNGQHKEPEGKTTGVRHIARSILVDTNRTEPN